VTLSIIDSDKLHQLSNVRQHKPVATLRVSKKGRAHLTTVHVIVDGIRFCLYADTHSTPDSPQEAKTAVDEFNADPSAWERLVAEALDAQAQIVDEDREDLDERAKEIARLRRRLLP